MNLSKVTLPHSGRPIDADGKDISPWNVVNRAKEIIMTQYCLVFLRIFEQNPNVDSILLAGELRQEYDDQGYYNDVRFDELVLEEKVANEILLYKLDGELFSTTLSYDDQEEDEEGNIIFAWNCDNSFIEENRSDLEHFFGSLGHRKIMLEREGCVHLLHQGAVDMDTFYKVILSGST